MSSTHQPGTNLITNAESGIDLTVLRCTFYRNFAGLYIGALSVGEAWPSVANMADNTCKMRVVMLCRAFRLAYP